MNAILEAMEKRRSVRKYKPDMVPQDAISSVISAGLYAASGMNRQDTIIIAVTNKEVRDRLSAANAEIMGTKSDPFYGAPVVLVVLASTHQGVRRQSDPRQHDAGRLHAGPRQLLDPQGQRRI